MDLSVTYIFSRAMELSKKHWRTVLPLLIAAGLAGFAIEYFCMPEGWKELIEHAAESKRAMSQVMAMMPQIITTYAFEIIVSFIISAGIYAYTIALSRNREMGIVEAFKMPAATYVKFICVNILMALAFAAGLIFFIIPGIYIIIRLMWAPFYSVEHKEAGVIDALKWSWNATKGRVTDLLLLGLVSVVIMFVAVILSSIFSMILATVAENLPLLAAAVAGFIALLFSLVVYFAETTTYVELTEE